MPLRPELYQRLLQRIGPVKIANEGVPMSYTVERDALTGKPRLNITNRGETYRVPCIFCNDRRQRLWINHRWGHKHPQTGTLNLWLSKCFHQDCLKDYERQKQLYRIVFEDVHNGQLPAPRPPAEGSTSPPTPSGPVAGRGDSSSRAADPALGL